MPIRAPIERWNRNELEEHFHKVSDEVKILKQNNQKMQKEIKIMNGRINAGVGTESRAQVKQNNNEYEDLQRSNKVLSQKLKVLKHQLLNYSTAMPVPPNKTRPNIVGSRPSTAQLPLNTKQRPQQRKTNFGRQRPKSSSIERNKISETFNDELIKMDMMDNSDLPTKLDEEWKTQTISHKKNEFKEDIQMDIKNFDAADEWEKNNRLREITKQNRTIIAENDDLRFSLEKSEKKLSTLSKEYDKIVIELTNARNGYQSQSESLSSFREEIQRRAENSSKTAQISDRELNILREEYNSIKLAYDKIIARSLKEENSERKTLDELSRLRSELQQINSDSDNERRQFEETINKLKLQNKQLEKELLEKEKANNYLNNNKITNNLIENEKKQIKEENNIENENEEHNKLIIKRPTTSNKENALLNKLLSDVMSIVETDVKNKNKIINNVNEEEINEINNLKWQKMYEDVYEELEKIRRLLLSEHELNNHLREEIKQKSIENEDLQEKYEKKLKELESELIKKDVQNSGFERALQSIADGNQILNNNLIFKNNENIRQIESTELSLTVSKLILTENCLKLAGNQNPAVFIAIEFFDFELQTSQIVNGPEVNLNFTSIFELTISDLFIHYLQTEGMIIELYIVQNDMNYKLCSQSTISLKKLLSIKTQTYFRGEINFFAPNEDESQKELNKSSLLLAKLYYNVKVPFSLLRALNAQRRRMAASAIIPLVQNNENEDFNEEIESNNNLIIQIHRCYNLNKLKGGEKDDIKSYSTNLMPSTYIAYEFFTFPLHMSKVIKNKANPTFDDIYTWKLPINSEAIHKYLLNEDLIIYLIEENSENIISSSSANSRSLGYISIPLFPLARNQTIKGTFPLTDRADESITSGASIDISIFWQFAYIFDDMKIITKTEHLINGNKILKENKQMPEMTIKESNNQNINETKELKEIKENNQQNDLIKKENISSDEEDEKNEEIEELELRKRLLSNKIPEIINNKIEQKIEKDIDLINLKQNNSENNELNEEFNLKSINLFKEQLEAIEENDSSSQSSKISDPKNIQSPKSSSSNSFEENLIIKEEEKKEEDDDNVSLRSDATYTMESENQNLDEEQKNDKMKEKEYLNKNEELLENVKENNSEESLLGVLPPIPAQRKSKIVVEPVVLTKESNITTNNSSNELAIRRAVEFSDPLHSSIPPSSISSFAESLDSSSRSNASSELNSKESFNEDQQKILQKEKKQLKKRKQINIGAIPSSPSIRLRKQESINENVNLDEEKDNFILNIFIGKLRLIEHSPLLRRQFDSGRVFVEWNLLDISRDLCETEGNFNLPRRHSEELNFDFHKSYILDNKRVDLLKQWTELNICLAFTLVLETEKDGELDDLCMGEFNLIDIINNNYGNNLIDNITMRDVDNLTIAILEVGIEYSEPLMNKIRDSFNFSEGDEEIGEDEFIVGENNEDIVNV